MKSLLNQSVEKAANHFCELYSEELQQVEADNIYEWYQNSLDQFGDVDYNEIEKRIFEKINK